MSINELKNDFATHISALF